MKSDEIMRRKKAKKDASIKYERAISEGNMADARKYAQQTTSMQDGMVDDSKKLLDSLVYLTLMHHLKVRLLLHT